jgi:hypothetical protein
MQQQRPSFAPVSGAGILLALWLLVGILITGMGWLRNHSVILYAGVFVTLAAVLIAVVRLVTRGRI